MITPDRARQMLLTAGADGFTAPEMLVTLELATQAPVMAEQIANMRYEYAVQVEEFPGIWRFLHSSGESTGWSTAAAWSKNFEMAPTPLANYRHRETTRSRIVRRLVSEPEVVE